MKWSLLSVLIFLYLPFTTEGQQKYQDVIYLKNNFIVRGVVIEQTLNKSVRFMTTNEDTLTYNIDEIEKLAREPIPDKNRSSAAKTWLSPGYQLIVEGGFAFGINRYGMDFYAVNIINSIRLNKRFSLGLGTGLRYNINHKIEIRSPGYDHVMVPVFTDFRAYFPFSEKVSIYCALDIGYSFSKAHNNRSYYDYNTPYNYINGVGLLLNPFAGMIYRISSRSALNIGIGYEVYKVEYDFSYYGQGSSHLTFDAGEKIVGSIGMNIGITF